MIKNESIEKKKPAFRNSIMRREVSPGIKKISKIFETDENAKPEKKEETKVRKVCNTFEEMMQDKGVRRKVYEVKRRKKKVIEKVEKDSKVRKNLEMWMNKEKDEKIQSQKTKVVKERKISGKIESKKCEKGAKSET